MTPVLLRHTRALTVCALVVASQILIVSGPARAGSDCQSLLKWAQATYAYRSPPTLEQLAAFDRPHRLAIFTAIPPDARAALWRAQLTAFSARADLTAAQRSFVEEVISTTTPAIYQQDAATRLERGRRYAERAAQLFTVRPQLTVFYDLGGAEAAAPAPLTERLTRPYTLAAQLPWCQCSTADSWPECIGPCFGATCEGWVGCGWGGEFPCDGYCAGR